MEMSLAAERLRAWSGPQYTFGQDAYKKVKAAKVSVSPTPLQESQRLVAQAEAGALDLRNRLKEPLDQTKARDLNAKDMPSASDIPNNAKARDLMERQYNIQREEVPKDSVAELEKTASQVRSNLRMNNTRLMDLMDEIKDFYESQARERERESRSIRGNGTTDKSIRCVWRALN